VITVEHQLTLREFSALLGSRPVGKQPRQILAPAWRTHSTAHWPWCDTGVVSLRTRLYWLGAALAAAALLIAGVDWYRSQPFTTTRLLQRLPADNALILSVDFRALRRAGILQMLDGSQAGQDPEYKTFVRKTNLNYQRDLDRALVAFAPTRQIPAHRGAFRLARLRAYVVEQGGPLRTRPVPHAGTLPERQISFFPCGPA